MNSENIKKLIDTNDIVLIKECIRNREKLNLNIEQIIKIIVKTKNIEFIRKCIFNEGEFDFLKRYAYDILKNIDDIDFIKECIYSNKKLKLETYMIDQLLTIVDNPDFAKKCILDYEKIGIFEYGVARLIKSLEDEEFTKECIFNKSLNIDSYSIKNLILSLKDKEQIKQCILKAKKTNLNSENVKELILLTNDEKFMKKCIKRSKKIGLESNNISEIISYLDDSEYAKKCIKKKLKIGISNEDARYLKILFNENYTDFLNKLAYETKINLSENMTIGIEIESIGRSLQAINRLKAKFFPRWKVDKDSTIKSNKKHEQGSEIISPILTGANEADERQIVNVCTILNEIGNYTNESCAGQIHIGAKYLKSAQSWKNLSQIYCNVEEILYIISNEKGKIPREDVLFYAPPVSLKFAECLREKMEKLKDNNDIDKVKNELRQIFAGNKYNRFSGINLGNINNWEEKCTIEFRIPNGTISHDTWIQNINLFGGIVKVSEEIATLQAKNIEELTYEEKNKIKLFKKLIKSDLTKKDKLKILLKLTVNEKDYNEFIERYEINSKLLKQNKNFRQNLKAHISKNPVKIIRKVKEHHVSEKVIVE